MILTVTVNPSLDTLYEVDSFAPGAVHRVRESIVTAGGKGLNVARVALALGETVTATGILGGLNGKKLLSLLPRGLQTAFVAAEGETRCCVNVYDQALGRHTELLEKGTEVSQPCLDDFRAVYAAQLARCKLVALSGSLLPGCPEDFYAQLIAMAQSAGKPVLLDTSGAALRRGVQARPSLIKPNLDEIAQLAGEAVHTMPQVMRAAKALQQTGIPWVVVSLGKDGAAIVCREGSFCAKTPDVPVKNTVGCGDSMIAGFAAGLARGENAQTCIRMGMAAATANALCAATGSIETKDYEWLLPQIEISRWQERDA